MVGRDSNYIRTSFLRMNLETSLESLHIFTIIRTPFPQAPLSPHEKWNILKDPAYIKGIMMENYLVMSIPNGLY